MRINKFLSTNGYCSRREADRLIKQGRVFINDQKASLGDQVNHGDDVRVEGRDRKKRKEMIYVMIHKPIGYTVTSRRKNARDLIDIDERLFSVGRMHGQTTGLLMYTNDGVLCNRLTNPKYPLEQEYVLELDQPIKPIDLGQIQQTHKARKLDLDRVAIIAPPDDDTDFISLLQDMGYRVHNLMRTRIGSLKMQTTYPEGNWRHLTEKEIRDLKRDVDLNPKR